MLDEAENKLPSFSNEPQSFADMTLFVGKDRLTLHIPSDVECYVKKGLLVEEIASSYLNYEDQETQSFMRLAEHQLRHLESCSARIGKPIPVLTGDARDERLKAYAREFANLHAQNCGDNHDLSNEFCAAASALGHALQQRAHAGVKTMTIINSGESASKFMKHTHG